MKRELILLVMHIALMAAMLLAYREHGRAQYYKAQLDLYGDFATQPDDGKPYTHKEKRNGH